MRKIILSLLSLFVFAAAVHAVQAYPDPVTVRQPDGTVLTIRLHGDEFLHWATCGNSLVAQRADGWWHYASFGADGVANAVGARVMSTSSGDGSSVTPPASAIAKAMEKRKSLTGYPMVSAASSGVEEHPISTGEKHFLILLIEFSDKSFTKGMSDFTDMLNGENYTYNEAVGSVRKYYNDVSFGKFSPVYDVYGPIKVSYTSAQCAENDVYAVIEACQKADSLYNIDFSRYCIQDPSLVDNVFFFFPGYNQAEGGGSDTIWPHAVTYNQPFLTLDGVGIYRYGCTSEYKGDSGATMAGIGTFCHEFGHIIGLPDFYDVDYSVNGGGLALLTLSLMSSGNYNNEGRTPPYFTYEEKHILGWDNGLQLLSEGRDTLQKTSANKSYYTPTSNEGEYYLYESRPCEGWDAYTQAPGMAIYHIDKSDYLMPSGYTAAQHWSYGYMINAYADHQCMDLVETVCPESEVDYYQQITFPGYDNVTSFTSGTSPAAVAWSGVATGYNIKNIGFDNFSGVTYLTLEKERKIAGTVKDLYGMPLQGVSVSIAYVNEQPVVVPASAPVAGFPALSVARFDKAPGAQTFDVTTDWEGKFEVPVTASGTYSLAASMEGYVGYSTSFSVDAVADIQITMVKPVEAAGEVLQKYSEISYYFVGLGSGYDCYGGLEYTAEELVDYVGSDINSISFMVYNGGDGTVDRMGVRVYFDDELQCDCGCPEVFNTLCTVDLSDYGLKIPSGKSVRFVYYVINPSCGWSMMIADWGNAVTGGNLYSRDGEHWYMYPNGNFVISATVTVGDKVLDLAGFNIIPAKSEPYTAGETFELKLKQSSTNPPSSVSWTMDGTPVSGAGVTLTVGVHTFRAHLTYPSGRVEDVEKKVIVQ